MHVMLPTYSLVVRELLSFFRQRTRVIGALLQPLLFWVLLGAGMNASFVPAGETTQSYLEYFYPGILLMIIMFTAIFSTITIIEDRRARFLQGVLVAPLAPATLVLGKVLGGAILAMTQVMLFLLILATPLLDLGLTPAGFVLLSIAMFGAACMLTALGVVMAWPMQSTHGYHALMSVVLFPLWMFSGSAFPLEGTPAWLHTLMMVNPMTHALAIMRGAFGPDLSVPIGSCGYVAVVTIILFAIAARLVARR
jgi:ABC-2 type transport system permease protein